MAKQTLMKDNAKSSKAMAMGAGGGNGDSKEKTVYIIPASELHRGMSFEFNCRAPSKASRAYRSMRATLAESPEKFLALNGGISIANEKFLLDGGHTYMAIMDAINEDRIDASRIRVSVCNYGSLSDAEMGRMSIALNRRVTPPLVGERDLEGAWNGIKKALPTKYYKLYEFRPNTSPEAHYKVDMLVALIHAWQTKQSEKSYASKGTLVRLYNDDKYQRVLPLLEKAINVYSFIYKTIANDRRLMGKLPSVNENGIVYTPDGEEVRGNMPEAYIWPIFGALAPLIDVSGEFTRDPFETFLERKDKLIKQLLADLKRAGSNPGAYGKDANNHLRMTAVMLGND